MSEVIKIKQGLDINLVGKAEKVVQQLPLSETFAVKPPDFAGLTPKLTVKVGDTVKAGSTLFFDKYNPDVKYASPVSGTVEAINRGERRRLLEVVVKADAQISYEEFKSGNPSSMSSEEVKNTMLSSGVWPLLTKRPFGYVAQPDETPKAIFITGFDSAPLAADFEFVAEGQAEAFNVGVEALKKLTDGSVHLGLKYGSANGVFGKSSAQVTEFDGPHPAGNVGTQINKIDPINKGEVVWTANAIDVIIIGRLFMTGKFDATKTIAVTGPKATKPQYVKTLIGAPISAILKGNEVTEGTRVVSGNPLTGTIVSANGYLCFKDNQVSLLEEGTKMEFMGWGAPGLNKFSISRTFLSAEKLPIYGVFDRILFGYLPQLLSNLLTPNEYNINTNLNGGVRPFVVTGQYEKVFPLDIMPVQLLKSIIINDIDQMEELGIYEVIEEDFALCEFVCTSKTEAQSIVREGLDTLYKELG